MKPRGQDFAAYAVMLALLLLTAWLLILDLRHRPAGPSRADWPAPSSTQPDSHP